MRIREADCPPVRLAAAGRRYLCCAAVGVVVAALTGCGGSSHKAQTSTSKTTSATTTRPAADSKPLVVVPAVTDDGAKTDHMRIAIYDVRRDGPYAVLDFGITCLSSATAGCDQELDFAAPSHSGQGVYANANTPSGVALVDPVGHKEYLPVRDSQNRPFDSELPSLGDSLTHLAWVAFRAPPASVGSVDVIFPHGGPQIPGIPVSSSAKPPIASAGVTAAQPAPFAATLGSTDTTGLTLPVEDLVSTVGNPNGSDSESATQATITLRSDVLFKFDKSNLTPTAHAILAQVAPQIKNRAIGPVAITGYTDSIGPDAVNNPLSIARAQSVLAALQPLTPGVSYQAAGKGSADPVAPNRKPDGSDNPAGRALNRRVTIVFSVKAPAPPTPPPASAPATGAPGGQSGATSFVVNDGSTVAHFQATVDALFRESDLLVLRMTLRCTSVKGPFATNCGGETELEGSNTVPPAPLSTDSDAYFTVSAFYLRDPSTGNEYIPLHQASGPPLTAGVGDLRFGDSYPVWLYFPAPPTSTSALTVVAPGGSASITGVSVSPSPPAQP